MTRQVIEIILTTNNYEFCITNMHYMVILTRAVLSLPVLRNHPSQNHWKSLQCSLQEKRFVIDQRMGASLEMYPVDFVDAWHYYLWGQELEIPWCAVFFMLRILGLFMLKPETTKNEEWRINQPLGWEFTMKIFQISGVREYQESSLFTIHNSVLVMRPVPYLRSLDRQFKKCSPLLGTKTANAQPQNSLLSQPTKYTYPTIGCRLRSRHDTWLVLLLLYEPVDSTG